MDFQNLYKIFHQCVVILNIQSKGNTENYYDFYKLYPLIHSIYIHCYLIIVNSSAFVFLLVEFSGVHSHLPIFSPSPLFCVCLIHSTLLSSAHHHTNSFLSLNIELSARFSMLSCFIFSSNSLILLLCLYVVCRRFSGSLLSCCIILLRDFILSVAIRRLSSNSLIFACFFMSSSGSLILLSSLGVMETSCASMLLF